MKLGVVTPRIFLSGQPILTSFIKIFEALYDEVFAITRGFEPEPLDSFGKKVRVKYINYAIRGEDKTAFNKAIEYLVVPLSICLNMFRMPKGTKTVVFLLGNISLVLPILIAKLLGKRIVLVLTGLYSKNAEAFYQDNLLGRLFLFVFRRLEGINLAISDIIIGYTDKTISEFNLGKYKDKISSSGARFIDTTLFQVTTSLSERKNMVGYIGRFREEKGILNFANAVPLLLKERPDIEFSMVGDGPLFNEVAEKIGNYRPGAISLTRWIPHDEVPEYLNRLKLLVIPSYSETGPYIALEAMACGTPVLSAPVGFIPDVVDDGSTGFILPDNSPESITGNVIRALSHPRSDEISRKARNLVKERYSYQAAVGRYREILFGKMK